MKKRCWEINHVKIHISFQNNSSQGKINMDEPLEIVTKSVGKRNLEEMFGPGFH